MTATALPDSALPLPSLPRYDEPPRLAGSQVVLLQQVDDPAGAKALAEHLGHCADALQVLVANAPQAGAALLEYLASASVGLQLFLSGDEAYLWPLHALARQAGLRPEEIHLLHQGEARRAIYCVHCTALQSGGPAEQHDCQQCGVRLEVRRHFSRRLGAYLGVCADADHPYAEGRP
jgi:hypothetical protein